MYTEMAHLLYTHGLYMFGKEMLFQVPLKTFRLNGRITQRIRQRQPLWTF